MKLFEIMQPQIRTTTVNHDRKTLSRAHRKMKLSPNTEFLGKGRYGYAVQLKTRPGTVIKSGVVMSFENDGYFRYINAVAKQNLAASNPYFPRVYSLKIYKNENPEGEQGHMYVAEMEKLTPLGDVDSSTLYALGERVFLNFDREVNRVMRKAWGYTQGKTHPSKKSRPIKREKERLDASLDETIIAPVIADLMTNTLMHGSLDRIKDPLLKQALMVIKRLNIKGKESFDTHEGNIMVRYGPAGGQLVITDPLI